MLRGMRAGAAVSRSPDVRLAARDAATRALDAAGLDEAGCLVVAATPEHLDESLELCEALRDAAGKGAQIVGGATSAVLVPGDADTEEGPALGVLALEQRAHLFSFRTDAPDELRVAAQRAGPGALGVVFADPAGPVQRLLAALGRDAGKARVAGGGVAVEGGLLLDDDLADAQAVGAFFPQAGRVAVAQSHQPIGKPLLVTRADGRQVIELDSRPALEALAELADQPGVGGEALQFVGLGLSPRPGEAFSARGLPLRCAARRRRGARRPGGGCADPEGHSVSFTLRDGMGARRTLQQALDRLAPKPPAWGIYFDCASRGSTLYGVDGLDLGLIEKSLGAFPLLSLRNQLRARPRRRFHGRAPVLRSPAFGGSMKPWPVIVLCAACASAPTRDPAACAAPSDRVEVEQVQIGWNRLDPGEQPPIVDVQRPSRDPRQAETLANELLVQCRQGAKMERLQQTYSEVQPGSLVIGAHADVPYKAAALCLQENECALVRSNVAFHVVKRIR